MKSSTFVLLLLVVCFVATGFQCGGCHAPNCYETTECDSTGWNCHTVRHHRHFTNPNFQLTSTQASQSVGILDLANPWQIDTNIPAYMKIKFDNGSNVSEQSFSVSLDPNISVSSVDKDTMPNTFVFDNPTAVSSFLSNASSAGFSSSEQIVTLSYSITQTDCYADSGKYVNHLRWMDSSGITYDSSFYIVYTAPTNVQANSCNQGMIVIE
ncbi:MAG TPA: hypothetical protein VGC97_16540 [Pyrinomonadaceae bacterium]|jgi:hypothetical protein